MGNATKNATITGTNDDGNIISVISIIDIVGRARSSITHLSAVFFADGKTPVSKLVPSAAAIETAKAIAARNNVDSNAKYVSPLPKSENVSAITRQGEGASISLLTDRNTTSHITNTAAINATANKNSLRSFFAVEVIIDTVL